MKKAKQSKSNVYNSDDEDKNPSKTYIDYESMILPVDVNIFKYKVEYIYVNEDKATSSFNDNFRPWVQNLEEQHWVHFYKYHKKKITETSFTRYVIYFTPYELTDTHFKLGSEHKLKITTEPLDSEDNSESGKVELLNLFYIKHFSYKLLNTSFLTLNGHSMKSKFVIIDSDDQYQPKGYNEQLLSGFFMYQKDIINNYLEYYLSRQLNIYLTYADGRMNLKLKSKMRMQKFNLADILYTYTDCQKDKRVDVKTAHENEVLMGGMIYKIAKVINNDEVQLKGRMDKKDYGVHRSDACDVKNILDFFNIEKRKKTDAEEVAERDYLKSVYPIVTKDLQAFINSISKGTYKCHNKERKYPFKKVDFNIIQKNRLHLQMSKKALTDEQSVGRDIMHKRNWFRFSNRNSTLRIYSSYDQNIFQKYCVGYFDNDVEIIQAKVETDKALLDILKNEEKNYHKDLDNYVFISVTAKKEEVLEKLYSIITKFKYQFRRDNLPIYVMFSYKQNTFEKKRENNKDVYNNIIKSLWLKNPENKPFYLNIYDFIPEEKGWTHVVIGMDIAHKKKTDRSNQMNSIVTLCYTIGNRIFDVQYERKRLDGLQEEYPEFNTLQGIIDNIMKNVKKTLDRERSKPWIHWIRDGINSTNIAKLQANEIDPLTTYLQANFINGFRFNYLNYCKDRNDLLLDERGDYSTVQGFCTDRKIVYEDNPHILKTIVMKPKYKGGKLMFYYLVHDSEGKFNDDKFVSRYADLLYNLNWMSMTHYQIVNHPMHIHLSDKDGRKIMVLQKNWDMLKKAKLIDDIKISSLIEFSTY